MMDWEAAAAAAAAATSAAVTFGELSSKWFNDVRDESVYFGPNELFIPKPFKPTFSFFLSVPWSFFEVLACHQQVLDVHLPLSRAINKSLQHWINFFPR